VLDDAVGLVIPLAILANLPFACAFWAADVVESTDPEFRAEARDVLDWWADAARRALAHTGWSGTSTEGGVL
jgi:hypothetical protein